MQTKSPGQLAYEKELTVKPNYDNGKPRPAWETLHYVVKWSWERNPVPRWTTDGPIPSHRRG